MRACKRDARASLMRTSASKRATKCDLVALQRNRHGEQFAAEENQRGAVVHLSVYNWPETASISFGSLLSEVSSGSFGI